MNKRFIVPLCCLALIAVGVAYAAYFVQSNIVNQPLQYTCSLSIVSVSGSNINLKAHVELNGNPMPGMTVKFVLCDSSGTPIGCGPEAWSATAITNSTGDATATYTATCNGNYYFVATLSVP